MAGGKQSPSRMLMLLPMLFLAQKLDFENPQILLIARAAFVCCQLLSLGTFFFIKQRIQAKNDTRKIFVPGVKSPFDQSPNYAEVTETTYVQHELAKTNEFIKQTLIGAGIAAFVHLKMGVAQVVLIQAVMAPINLWDNPLVQPWIFGKRDGRIWNEKLEGEPIEVDAPPATAATDATAAATADKSKAQKAKKLADVTPAEAIAQALLKEAEADFDELWEVVKKDVNATTKDDKWTALMVACGSPIDTDEFIRKAVAGGADATAVDSDGWTALHWSAFHGRPEAAATLLDCVPKSKIDALLGIKDAEGRTPQDVATEEGNEDVIDVLKKAAGATTESDATSASELRQRKGAAASSVEDVD